MDLEATTPVARVATKWPATIRVFQDHGIDFCCRGGRSLEAACAERSLDLGALMDELVAAEARPEPAERDWTAVPLAELVEHIESRYHQRLRDDLPRLSAMAEAVIAAHGTDHPEVREVASVFNALRRELESHTAKEEAVLFPAVTAAESGETNPGGDAAASTVSPDALGGPIQCLEEEHDEAGRALERLRELTGGYQPPSGACPTFRGWYHGLAELESDTHRHIHLENNILFPRAAELTG